MGFLDPRDRTTLEGWVRAQTTPQRTVLRSRIVLLLADGLSAREVARRLGVSRHTVDLWRKRYLEEGRDTLTRDRAGRGRKRGAAGAAEPTATQTSRSLSPRWKFSCDVGVVARRRDDEFELATAEDSSRSHAAAIRARVTSARGQANFPATVRSQPRRGAAARLPKLKA